MIVSVIDGRSDTAGLVRKRRLPPPAGSVVYELTDSGSELEPMLIALGRWGGRYMAERRNSDVFFPAGHISGMRATFDPDRAGDLSLTAELRVDGQPLSIDISGGRLEAKEGAARKPALIIETDTDTSIDLMLRRLDPMAALRGRRVRIEGSETDYRRLLNVIAWVPPA